MILPPNVQASFNQYLDAKYGESSKFPHIKVTEEEFVRLMVEQGGLSEKNAKSQAFFAKNIGGDCKIGNRWVGIKDNV